MKRFNYYEALITLFLLSIVLLASCQKNTGYLSDNVVSKPPAPYVAVPPTPSKPYHNLSTAVSEVVSAYESGGNAAAEAYAKKYGIGLVNDMIRVIIKINPGGKAAAVDAVNSAGGRVQIALEDSMQALVPLSQIKSLADNPAIKSIMEPTSMVPATMP